MCGLLGQFGSDLSPENQFLEALHLMEHRGPDNHGFIQTDGYMLGHRRLSIIDLQDAAKQPMPSNCGRYTLSFNGEIYNYRELKEELLQNGAEFKTNGDSEVLLNGLCIQGMDFLKKCIGMFAGALVDNEEKTTYLFRDRLGIKPLFFSRENDRIVFGSEVRPIIKLLRNKPTLRSDAFPSYFAFRYPIQSESFFEEIQAVKPGHFIKIDRHLEISENLYWSLAPFVEKQKEDLGEDYYLEKTEELLLNSVELRMHSDVDFGAYLSGGVDSSLIVAMMAKLSDSKIKTFTVGFHEEGYNEFEYADIVAKQYETEHHQILLNGDNYFEALSGLIEKKGAPLSVPNEIPLFQMSQELKKHITVVLSGEGADEIFGGYGRIFRSPDDYQKIISAAFNSDSEFGQKALKKYGRTDFKSEVDHFLEIYAYTKSPVQREIFESEEQVKNAFAQFSRFYEKIFAEPKTENYRAKLMYAFERVHLRGLLSRLDGSTMATSVEGRVPFVDHRLVEFVSTIPEKYKLKWVSEDSKSKSENLVSDEISEVHDVPKYLLKKIGEKYLPHDVLYRRKMGFPVPLNLWFGGQFKTIAENYLLSEKALKRGLFREKWISQTLNSNELAKNHSLGMKVWMLLNLEVFMQTFID